LFYTLVLYSASVWAEEFKFPPSPSPNFVRQHFRPLTGTSTE